MVCFDNILVYFVDVVMHLVHLSMVMEVLQRYKLHINLKKCSFLHNNMEFLGFIVGIDKILAIESKIQAIREWPTLKTIEEVS